MGCIVILWFISWRTSTSGYMASNGSGTGLIEVQYLDIFLEGRILLNVHHLENTFLRNQTFLLKS
jgi:hypothetical protein